jgi:hypothetical protein
MPWRCPACGLDIHHYPTEELPDPRADYRCHLCRLNLRFDLDAKKMMAKVESTPRPTAQTQATEIVQGASSFIQRNAGTYLSRITGAGNWDGAT